MSGRLICAWVSAAIWFVVKESAPSLAIASKFGSVMPLKASGVTAAICVVDKACRSVVLS